MSNAYIPDTKEAHVEWSVNKIMNFLGITSYTDGSDIVKQLIAKDVDLNPRHLAVLFDSKLQLLSSAETKFLVLKEVMEQLRTQGIYIPYILDSYTVKNGVGYIAQSKYHPLGPLPVTKHNALDVWRWMKYGQSTQVLLSRYKKIESIARELHESWKDRQGWEPWAPATQAVNYQNYAMVAAQERVDQEDRAEMKWDQVMEYAKSMCEEPNPLELPRA